MGRWKERQEKEKTEGIQNPVLKERRGPITNQK
jgi:hypothetical protein